MKLGGVTLRFSKNGRIRPLHVFNWPKSPCLLGLRHFFKVRIFFRYSSFFVFLFNFNIEKKNKKYFICIRNANFEPFCCLYKLCVTEKRKYVNKWKSPIFQRFCCQYPLINYLVLRQVLAPWWYGKKIDLTLSQVIRTIIYFASR